MAILSLALAGRVSLEAWEWPASEAALRSGFLVRDDGLPSRGISFEPTDEPIRAAHAGEITFSGGRDRFTPGFVQPQGGYIVVDHGNGFRALYDGIEPGARSGEVRIRDILGRPDANSVRFSVFDMVDGVYANPLDLLPRRWSDRGPQIDSVSFEQNDNPRVSGARIRLERDAAMVSVAVRSRLVSETAAVLPRTVEFAVGSQMYHILTVDRLLPGVFAQQRDIARVESPAENDVLNGLEEVGGDTPLEVTPQDSASNAPIDERQLPGVAVTPTPEQSRQPRSRFQSVVDSEHSAPIPDDTDVVIWPGGWRLASELYDAAGRLRVGTVTVGAQTINTGVVLRDTVGTTIRRNISIDPAPEG